MVKIVLKTAVLIFVIFSIYFIVNPSACSNFLAGRVTNQTELPVSGELPAGEHGEMFTPVGDKPLATVQRPGQAATSAKPQTVEGIVDTNTLTQEEPQYSQEDIDYAIASRYVELENEYAKQNKVGKNVAKEISYMVMDDFELTQSEWEAFLARATASNLFDKIRTEQAATSR